MKLCSYSPQFKHLLHIIMEDDLSSFIKNYPLSFDGQIDNKKFLNFCLESKSYRILKNIVRNKNIRDKLLINTNTLELLLKSKELSTIEKTYIYTKIIKNKLKISDKKLLNLIINNDMKALFWLNKSKKLNISEYIELFPQTITPEALQFCRQRNVDIIKILLKSHKSDIIIFEDYTYLLLPEELYRFVNESLLYIKKEEDINLLDSIIKILIDNQYLIEKIDIDIFREIRLNNTDFFFFLNMDIEKVLLYKKFSQKKFKTKVNKI